VDSANGSGLALTVVAVHQRSLDGTSSTDTSGATTAGNRVRQNRRALSEFLGDPGVLSRPAQTPK